ncbi:hypothetical protein ABEB36_004154 [Hypothenemus hampei]|uniref:Gustatory receptor n=1 Tax=Hypothenemus hampei TaxID=57062 RepID=A0ABD1F525_HYPHA
MESLPSGGIDFLKISRFITSHLAPFAYIPQIFFPKQHWNGLLKIVRDYKKLMNYQKNRKLIHIYFLLLVIFHVFIFDNGSLLATLVNITSICGIYYEFIGSIMFSIIVIPGVEQKLLEMLKILRELHKKKIISMGSIKELKILFMSALANHQLINDYFCLNLLASYGALLMIANSWGLKLESSIQNESAFKLNTHDKWIRFMFLNVYTLISVVIITMTCKRVSQNVTNVIMNCYLLQSKIRYNSYEYKEIRALWTFIFENQLSFSAGGTYLIYL